MYCEDKAADSVDKSREFGVLGNVLRELQREEFEEIETCLEEIQETSMTQSTTEILAEINSTLKEIAETQKKILEEIQKNRTE
jgi:tRNA(Ser,Leu) C12 N-acetylase TAN1